MFQTKMPCRRSKLLALHANFCCDFLLSIDVNELINNDFFVNLLFRFASLIVVQNKAFFSEWKTAI